MIQKMLALAEWQGVEDGSHETMLHVEIRGAVLARIGAERVLGREVVRGAADGAGGIQGLGKCVGNQSGQAGSKTLAQLGADAIVIPIAVGSQPLDSRGPEFRIGQAGDRSGGSGNRLTLIDQVVQVAALRAVVRSEEHTSEL